MTANGEHSELLELHAALSLTSNDRFGLKLKKHFLKLINIFLKNKMQHYKSRDAGAERGRVGPYKWQTLQTPGQRVAPPDHRSY